VRDGLELGSRSQLHGGSFGKLVDVVIDPTSRRVTHLVVERDRDPWLGRLVPVELAERGGDAGEAVALRATGEEVRRLPPVHEVAYLRLDGFPVEVARVETDAVTLSLRMTKWARCRRWRFGAGCARSSIEDRGGSINKE
jgi:hypothetical protein